MVVKPGLYLNETSDTVTDIKIKRVEQLGHLIRTKLTEFPRLPKMSNLRVKGRLGDQSYDGLMTNKRTLK